MRAYDARKKLEMIGAMVLRLPAETKQQPQYVHPMTAVN